MGVEIASIVFTFFFQCLLGGIIRVEYLSAVGPDSVVVVQPQSIAKAELGGAIVYFQPSVVIVIAGSQSIHGIDSCGVSFSGSSVCARRTRCC